MPLGSPDEHPKRKLESVNAALVIARWQSLRATHSWNISSNRTTLDTFQFSGWLKELAKANTCFISVTLRVSHGSA